MTTISTIAKPATTAAHRARALARLSQAGGLKLSPWAYLPLYRPATHGRRIAAYAYTLVRPLTATELQALGASNARTITRHHRYAPEVKEDILIFEAAPNPTE